MGAFYLYFSKKFNIPYRLMEIVHLFIFVHRFSFGPFPFDGMLIVLIKFFTKYDHKICTMFSILLYLGVINYVQSIHKNMKEAITFWFFGSIYSIDKQIIKWEKHELDVQAHIFNEHVFDFIWKAYLGVCNIIEWRTLLFHTFFWRTTCARIV